MGQEVSPKAALRGASAGARKLGHLLAGSTDLDRVFEILRRLADDLSVRSRARPPQILMTGFGASSIDFEVSVWLDDPWPHRQARSEVGHAIWRAFKEEGIVIAFPQVDVHLDPEVVTALSRQDQSSEARSTGL